MSEDLSTLLDFVQDNQSDPVALAKILVAWEFASLGPGNPTPNSVEETVSSLEGQCGWRDQLLRDLFGSIGIEGRRVEFYDVAFRAAMPRPN